MASCHPDGVPMVIGATHKQEVNENRGTGQGGKRKAKNQDIQPTVERIACKISAPETQVCFFCF